LDNSKISRADIHNIWQAHHLGPVSTIEPILSASRNLAYYVNDDFILRVNHIDPHLRKFRNEQAALERLAGAELPVPQAVLLDESRSIIPYDLIVLTRLPGASIAESRASLAPEEVTKLAAASGRALDCLHQIEFAQFGDFSDLVKRPFATWQKFFLDYAEYYLAEANRSGQIDSAQEIALNEILLQMEPQLAGVNQGVFVHSDFHYENILQQDGRLTGLLDFEWAHSGDPAADFVSAGERQRVLPESEEAFMEGYLDGMEISNGFWERVKLYRIFLDLEDAVTCRRLGDPEGAAQALHRMDQRLAGWED
jgi:aminoglycoside phosphotransferase (APT) family kinase protein